MADEPEKRIDELDHTAKIDKDAPIDKTVKIDRTVKIDKTVVLNSSGKNSTDNIISKTARLKNLISTTSKLGFLSGVLGARTVDISDIVSHNGLEDKDEVRPNENIIGEEFNDFNTSFEIREKIATGGQGYISRAVDKKLQRIVAIKSLHEKLKERNSSRRSFIAEARVTGQLDHPAIISVHGLYSDSKHGLHLAMKLVKGNTLKRYLEKLVSLYRILPRFQIRRNEHKLLNQRLDIFLRVCEAISYAHHKKVIHRDLKPENIMIGSFNETYVMDWGIAEHQSQRKGIQNSDKLAGTVQYIAPEIINRQPYDSRSDIYSLGLILFEIVFLKQAYASETLDEAIQKAQLYQVGSYEHQFRIPVDRDLKMIIRKALAPEPSERYQNVRALAKDIRDYLQFEEVSANPDHFFGKIVRHFRRHYKLMLFFFSILLLSCMTAASYFLYREIEDRTMKQKQEAALAEIYSKGIHSGTLFDHRLHSLKNLLSTVAWETALLLENPAVKQTKNKLYSYKAGEAEENAPPGFEASPIYRQKISLDTFVYKEPSGEKIPELDKILQKLYPLKKGFFRALSRSLAEVSLIPAEDDLIREMIRNEVKPPFSWVYIGLKNGLHLCYPYHSDYNESYDPRTRPWYEMAIASPKYQVVWGPPYIDNGALQEPVITCSKAIVGNEGEVLGVAGADISMSSLTEMLSKMGNVGPAIKNKYFVNEDGDIVIDTGSIGQERPKGLIQLKPFHDPELLKIMWSRRNGRIFVTEDGVRYLYFFLGIETIHWLYIERINFVQLVNSKQIKKSVIQGNL